MESHESIASHPHMASPFGVAEVVRLQAEPRKPRVSQRRLQIAKSKLFPLLFLCFFAFATFAIPSSHAEDAPATAEDELALRQSDIADRYGQLEKLILRMVEFDAADNPRRAELLKQAFALSKDRHVTMQLDKLVELLNQRQLGRAVSNQKDVNGDLNAILELLLSENRADRLKDEQARIRGYIKEIERIERTKASRDPVAFEAAIENLKATAAGDGNLLEAAVEAARARATVGEISDAMEAVFGRHKAEVKTLAGVYGSAYEGDEDFAAIQKDIEAFAEEEGRRPRMLVVKMGQDGHDRGAKVIASAFADIGFDVDVGPLFQTPEEVAQDALDNDVHVIGVSSQAAGHKTLAPALIKCLSKEGAGEILVVCGGVIPHQDYDFLKAAGVAAIFGPGTNIPQAAQEVLALIRARRTPKAAE